MRIFLLSILSCFSFSLSGQLSDDIIWPTDIQELYDRSRVLVKNSQYKELQLCYDTLLVALDKRKTKNPIKGEIQNYYHFQIKQAVTSMRLYKKKEARDTLLVLEQELKQAFPKGSILFGSLYNVLGLVSTPGKEALHYLEKALKIRTQYLGAKNSEVGITLSNISSQYKRLGELSKAEEYNDRVIEISETLVPQDTNRMIVAYVNAAQLYYTQTKYEQSLDWLQKAELLAKQSLPSSHRYNEVIYLTIGNVYDRYNNSEKSLEYIYKALQIKKDRNKEKYHPSYVINYANLARIHSKLSQIKKANACIDTAIIIQEKVSEDNDMMISLYITKSNLVADLELNKKYLEKALEYVKKSKVNQHYNEGVIYNNLSTNYKKRGDTSEGINYLYKSRKAYEKGLPETKRPLARNYFNTSTHFEGQGKYEMAIEYIQKALEITKDIKANQEVDNIDQYRGLAILYTNIADYDKAYFYLNKTLQIEQRNIGKETTGLADTYRSFGYYYYKQEKYKDAIHFYSKGIQIINKIDVDRNYSLPGMHIKVADCHEHMGNKEEVLQSIMKSFTEVGIEKVDGKFTFENVPELYMWRTSKAYFAGLKLLENDNWDILSSNILEGIQALDKIKASYFYNNSGTEFQKKTREYFDWSIDEVYRYYEEDPSQDVMDFLFFLIEKSKSNNIRRGYERIQSHAINNVPQSILDREKTILYEYENVLQTFSNNQLQSENESESKQLQEEIILWQENKESFMDSLVTEYPEYYDSRYKFDVIPLQELQEKCNHDNVSFYNYYWGDSTLICILTTPENSYVHSVSPDKIKEAIQVISSIMQDRGNWDIELDYKKIKETFIKNAYLLYSQLIDPNIDHTQYAQWIISGDKDLIDIPFDIILTREDSASQSYKNLSYLFKDKIISYALSATQLNTVPIKAKRKYAYTGYAPSYSSSDTVLNEDMNVRSAIPFLPLYQNVNEISSSVNIMGGLHFSNEEATERLFKKNAMESNIIHLAMHTLIDPEVPSKSYLKFSDHDLQSEDSKLHTYEIAQMNLSNDLIVLSACETNTGTDNAGDGIKGIAKSFQLAGSPNIVMSQWLVDDASASKIIFDFFTNVNEGKSFAESLTLSKRNYLQECTMTKSFPAFWATFSYYGDPHKAIQSSSHSNALQWIAIVAVLYFLIFFIIRKLK